MRLSDDPTHYNTSRLTVRINLCGQVKGKGGMGKGKINSLRRPLTFTLLPLP
jgi:hypothetical protein